MKLGEKSVRAASARSVMPWSALRRRTHAPTASCFKTGMGASALVAVDEGHEDPVRAHGVVARQRVVALDVGIDELACLEHVGDVRQHAADDQSGPGGEAVIERAPV